MSIPFDAVKPINRWSNDYIQPGNTGSVGDVNVAPRLRNSTPSMPVRHDPDFAYEQRLGMNVQNGTSYNFWGGQFPQKFDSRWDSRPGFRTSHGWIHQDLRAPDKIHEPKVGELPQYSWDNKIATTYNAMRTGNMFLPLPGQYALGITQTPRGQQIPRIVDTEQGDGPFNPMGDQIPDQENIKRGIAHDKLRSDENEKLLRGMGGVTSKVTGPSAITNQDQGPTSVLGRMIPSSLRFW
jgi:hypothetical protein